MYNKLINKVPATKNNHKKKTNISITTSRCIGRKHEARGGNGETPATDRGDGMMGGGTPVDVRWVMVMKMVIKMLMGTVVSDADDYDDDSCEDLEQQR